jgi:hypothetical protein
MPSDVVDDIVHKVSRVRVGMFDTLNRSNESSLVVLSPESSFNRSLDSE